MAGLPSDVSSFARLDNFVIPPRSYLHGFALINGEDTCGIGDANEIKAWPPFQYQKSLPLLTST